MTRQSGQKADAAPLVAITGAAGGVGRALVTRLHAAGYRLLLLDREEAVRALAEEVGATAWVVDVADEAAVQRVVGEILRAVGVPDVWVNNAGVGRWGPFDPSVAGGEREEMAVNYHGSVHCIRALLPPWRAQGRGHLIQVTSSAALFHGPWMASYSASKAAIGFFVRALRVELRGAGIAITEILPNTIRTPMSSGSNRAFIPKIASIRPDLTPDEMAAAIHRAIRQRPREVRLPWLVSPFALLLALAPALVDWLLAWGPRGPRD